MNFYYELIMRKKKTIKEIEKNIAILGGKKIEYADIQQKIRQYVYCFDDQPEYTIYCHNSIDRVSAMSSKEFIYYLTNKCFRNDYNLSFYHIPYKEGYKNKDKDFLEKYKGQLNELDMYIVSVKEILVIIGTYNDIHIDFIVPNFPFNMLEEKQKEIKDFILNGNK